MSGANKAVQQNLSPIGPVNNPTCKYHPDKSGSAATGEAFAAINAAWTKIDGGGY